MRLIDADAFKKVLDSGGGESTDININKSMPLGEIVDIVIHAYRKCLFAELEKMPTAYDVDKVMQRIDNEVPGLANLQIYKIDEIVKAGMKEN